MSDVLEASSEITNGITLTFDDGFRNVLDHGLQPLAECGYRAIQFLLPDLLGRFNEWEQVEGEWKEVPRDAQERAVDSGPQPERVRFDAREGGSWHRQAGLDGVITGRALYEGKFTLEEALAC